MRLEIEIVIEIVIETQIVIEIVIETQIVIVIEIVIDIAIVLAPITSHYIYFHRSSVNFVCSGNPVVAGVQPRQIGTDSGIGF